PRGTFSAEVFPRVVTGLPPILCFTMEEAWTLRFPDESVHLHTFLETPAAWSNAGLVEKWNRVRAIRRVVTGALEVARRDKTIGASLEASPPLYLDDEAARAIMASLDLAEIAITSTAHIAATAAPDDAFRLPGRQIDGLAA